MRERMTAPLARLSAAMVVAVAMLVAAAAPAAAQDGAVEAGSLVVSEAWARASIMEGRPAAVFMKIENRGKTGDALVSATTSAAARAELHTHVETDGVMRMEEVPEIKVAAGGSVELKPGGYHVMLFDLPIKLKAGETFPLTVTFKSGMTTTVMVSVVDPKESRGKADEHDGHHGNGGGHNHD